MLENSANTGYKNSLIPNLLVAACFLSNLSQLPIFVNAGLTQKLNTPIWIVLLLVLIIAKRIVFYRRMLYIIITALFISAGLMVLQMFTNQDYFSSSIISCLIMSLFIYVIGEWTSPYLNLSSIKKIFISYTISTLIVSIAIYVEYFSSGFDLTSRVYAYSSKNSISQIIFTAVVLLMLMETPKKKLVVVLRWSVVIFLVFLMFLLRSRATLAGFLFCAFYIVCEGRIDKKIKYPVCIALIAVSFAVLFDENVSTILIDNILFASRDVTDFNSLSSGRLAIIEKAPQLLEDHWLTGIGSMYFECFPLSVILQFGVLVGPFILYISYLPFFKCFKFRKEGNLGRVFFVVCIGYVINSMFEGLAPIGPGVKCYFLWLLFGILINGKFEREEIHG